MFVLRSAFWLTMAFLMIRPGVDINAAAGVLTNHAMSHGQQFIAQQIAATDCQSLQCAGGKALLAAALPKPPHAGSPMHDSPAPHSVALPRPRPDRAG